MLTPMAVEVLHDGLTPEQQQIQDMQQLFAALANETRISILKLLIREGEQHVGALTQLTGDQQSQVSHQLRVLRDNKLVRFRRDGNQVRYRIASENVERLVELALGLVQ